jgi:hypothetical protein
VHTGILSSIRLRWRGDTDYFKLADAGERGSWRSIGQHSRRPTGLYSVGEGCRESCPGLSHELKVGISTLFRV